MYCLAVTPRLASTSDACRQASIEMALQHRTKLSALDHREFSATPERIAAIRATVARCDFNTMGVGMRTSRFDLSLLFLVTSIVGITGCAHARWPSDSPAVTDIPWVSSSRDIITTAEISKMGVLSAYDLVARLRPEYLKSNVNRGVSGSVFTPVVYINGLMAGEAPLLREISTDMIREIRYVPPRDAVWYRGQAHRGGEIMVYTDRSRTAQPPF